MMEFHGVTDGKSPLMSFGIERGSVAVLKTASGFESDRIFRMMAGLDEPASGSIRIDGEDIFALSAGERLSRFRKIGIVWRDGGIISNLKVWENIALPAAFHGRMGPAEAEPLVRKYYGIMGNTDLDALMAGSPGALPRHEKVLVAIVRTMIMEPELVIYDNVLEGADRSWGTRLGGMLMDFHRTHSGRTSVFVSSSDAEAAHIEADMTIDTRQVA